MSATPITNAAAFFVPDPFNFHPGEPIEVVLAAKARELEAENVKLRFLISEVVETQPVSDACRDDLRAALKT